jgi:apolipoprotein D and lipocalin family protein
MSSESNGELRTVEKVELDRYLGRWFQLAYFPARFQPVSCGLATAEYSLKRNGRIEVLNSCWGEEFGGKPDRSAKGTAWPADETNSKLKVRFFWPFKADYWVIDLGEDYEYTVVSEPSKKYLWILCRDMSMDDAKFSGIIERLRENGFDLSRLVYTADQKPPQ